MIKVVLLGASGPSGLQVLKHGLQRGYEIRAVVRDPAKITQTHENLKVQFRTRNAMLLYYVHVSSSVCSCFSFMIAFIFK